MARSKNAEKKAIQAYANRRKGKTLWGKGKGNFKTQGNYGSAGIRG